MINVSYHTRPPVSLCGQVSRGVLETVAFVTGISHSAANLCTFHGFFSLESAQQQQTTQW